MKVKTDTKKIEKSQVEISVVMKSEDFAVYYDKALSKITEIAEVDGFRKGHAPKELILSKFGEAAILQEMSDMAVQDTFAQAILDSKVDAIGRPDVMVTKLAKDNDFEYKLTVAVIPELDLPDYHKLAKAVAKDKVEVDEKDVEDVVLEVRKMRAHKDLHKDEAGNEVEHDHKDESHNHAHDEIDKKSVDELPELTDEYVATLGDFKSVDEFLVKVRENVTLEKEQRNLEKRRNEILQVIVDNTKGEIPEILIESETDRMLAQMKGDVAQMGGKFDEYLSYIKKTETDLRNEWRADAEKRAKIQIVLNTIAKEHKIEPEKDLVEKEATRLTEMYSDADMERARDYVYQLMQNEEVLKFLEK